MEDPQNVVLPSESFTPVSIVGELQKKIENVPEHEAQAAAEAIAHAIKTGTSAKQALQMVTGILGSVAGILK